MSLKFVVQYKVYIQQVLIWLFAPHVQTQQMIAKLMAEREQLHLEPGLQSTYTTLKDAAELKSTIKSPDLIHNKRVHDMHLTFSDLSMSTPTIDSSPQSTATLFTCVGSTSDFEPSQCSSESLTEYASSLDEHFYLQNTSNDAENRVNVRFKRSVSGNDDKPQGENDAPASKVVESCVVNEGVLECQMVDGASGCRRDFPSPMFFLFDEEELTFKPPKYEKTLYLHRKAMTP